MENISEAITAKEGKELEMKDFKEFKLSSEKDTFQIKIGKNLSKNTIIFHALKLNELVENFYENGFTFDELVKLDKTFRAYDELEEIFLILQIFSKNKKL